MDADTMVYDLIVDTFKEYTYVVDADTMVYDLIVDTFKEYIYVVDADTMVVQCPHFSKIWIPSNSVNYE